MSPAGAAGGILAGHNGNGQHLRHGAFVPVSTRVRVGSRDATVDAHPSVGDDPIGRALETGGRPSCQRWYTEADALFLVTRSEKAEAVALTKAMIQVVIAVRRHLLSTVAVVAHSRRPPTPRLPPSPAPVPEARQLPPPMRRFRDLPEWGALRAAARLDVSSDALDVLGAWHMPMLDDIEHARTMVTPAAVVAMARTFQSHLSPSALAHEAAAARLAH